MFILDNVLIILMFTLFLFVLFTFMNILTFSRGFLTAVYLTFIFFDLFFRMPFKVIQLMYNDRDKVLKSIEKSTKLTEEQKQFTKHILQKRTRLFVAFYKAGQFSYSEVMESLGKWYKNKPFKVRIKFDKQKKQSYESKYINDKKKDFVGLEAY